MNHFTFEKNINTIFKRMDDNEEAYRDIKEEAILTSVELKTFVGKSDGKSFSSLIPRNWLEVTDSTGKVREIGFAPQETGLLGEVRYLMMWGTPLPLDLGRCNLKAMLSTGTAPPQLFRLTLPTWWQPCEPNLLRTKAPVSST